MPIIHLDSGKRDSMGIALSECESVNAPMRITVWPLQIAAVSENPVRVDCLDCLGGEW